MSKREEQKIVVFTTLSETDKILILNGVRLAALFKKELCLCYLVTRRERKQKALIKQILTDYTHSLKEEISGLKTSVLLLREKIYEVPAVLADEYEAILFVADAARYKKFAAAVTQSATPFLTVNPGFPMSTF